MYRIRSQKLAELYWYWRGLCRDGRLPGRDEIKPEAIPGLLSRIWLVDVERVPLRFRVRLVGSDHYTAYGAELTGRYLSEDFFGTSWGTVLKAHTDAAEQGQPQFRASLFKPPEGGPGSILVESVFFPLARDGRTVDMIMGCQAIELQGTGAHALRKTLLGDLPHTALAGVEVLTEDHLPPSGVHGRSLRPQQAD